MWLQTDRVSCLKTLINTIISTFTDIQENYLGCLFCLKIKNFPESFFEIPKSNFTDCLINGISCIYIYIHVYRYGLALQKFSQAKLQFRVSSSDWFDTIIYVVPNYLEILTKWLNHYV